LGANPKFAWRKLRQTI